MQTGDFDFDDYLLQVQSVKKMGGMQSMMKMIPGETWKKRKRKRGKDRIRYVNRGGVMDRLEGINKTISAWWIDAQFVRQPRWNKTNTNAQTHIHDTTHPHSRTHTLTHMLTSAKCTMNSHTHYKHTCILIHAHIYQAWLARLVTKTCSASRRESRKQRPS